MKGKGFVVRIPGCSGFQASYIRTVTQLGLCIASDDLVVLGFPEKQLMLFRSSLVSERDLVENVRTGR